MIRFNRTATVSEIEHRRRLTLDYVGYKEDQSGQVSSSLSNALRGKEIDGMLLRYLRDLQDHPGLKAKERDELCGYSSAGGSRLRTRLKAVGLADFRKRSDGRRGGGWDDWHPTRKGLDVLELNRNQNGTE